MSEIDRMNEIKNKKSKLADIEGTMTEILDNTTGMWSQVAILMMEVDKERLWDVQHLSFTQWVRSYAEKIHKHESYLWKILKAGKVYSKYYEDCISNSSDVFNGTDVSEENDNINNVIPTPLKNLRVDMQALELVDKVSGGNAKVRNDLCKKVENGELKRADLKAAWKKQKREKEKEKYLKKLGNKKEIEEVKDESRVKKELKKNRTEAGSAKASEVLEKVRLCNWIPLHEKELTEGVKAWQESTSITYPEFPVQTGTSKSARRIDALVISNRSLDPRERNHNLELHGIEIKVSVSDLRADIKTSEYMDFVDYMWFAIPNNKRLIETIETEHIKSVGILVLDKGKDDMIVYRQAKRLDPVLREETLMTALLH